MKTKIFREIFNILFIMYILLDIIKRVKLIIIIVTYDQNSVLYTGNGNVSEKT